MINTDDDKDREIERLRQENAAKDKVIADKDAEIERLREVEAEISRRIRRAKNIDPVSRPSLFRVKCLAECAGLEVDRVEGGYQMSFGFTLKRVFKKLSHIFDILILDNWYLSDIFKPDFIAPNKYGYVPPNSSFNNSVENSTDDCSSEPLSILKKKLSTAGSLTTVAVHEVISAVLGGTRQLANQVVQTVDKYGDIVSQKLSSTPFADSYTDETLNQAQNSYDTWDESLDDFSPA